MELLRKELNHSNSASDTLDKRLGAMATHRDNTILVCLGSRPFQKWGRDVSSRIQEDKTVNTYPSDSESSRAGL